MTREEALDFLIQCAASTDTQNSHKDADKILCLLLEELGYADVVVEYEKVYKWYS